MISSGANIFPSPFFSGQQIFDQPFATVPQPVHGQIPPPHKSFCTKTCSNSLADRQGRNDTLRALKRKIQENYTTPSCKPSKLARMMHHPNNGFGMGGSSPVSAMQTEPVMCQSLPPVQSSFNGPALDHGPMQMLYSCRDIQRTLAQKKGPIITDRLYKPVVKMEDKNNNEQVVPDITVPSCYLTPEASPVSSPQPSKESGATTDVHSFNPVLVAKYICTLKQKQLTGVQEKDKKAKKLPSLDVSFVDSFFDELGTLVVPNTNNIDKEPMIKTEPIDIDDLIDVKQTDSFDVEDILALSDPEPEMNGGKSINIKIEVRDNSFSVPEGHTNSLPLSPVSSITEDRLSCDELSYCALTPESDLDSDHYDDIMDPDNWMLQSLKLPCQGVIPDLEKVGNVQMVSDSGETELHQLRKFISSWTPSGK